MEPLLAESFEGWYLSHSRKTLMSIEVVREAVVDERPVGLAMLKTFYGAVGYVYYIAVAREHRRRGIGTLLLDHSLEYFSTLSMKDAYASIEKENAGSAGLFGSCGFVRTSFREVSGKYGSLNALNLYRKMLVVPGEMLLCRQLNST